MSSAPTRVPTRATKPRSPARQALADHHERLRQAIAAAAVARQPFDRAYDQVEHSKAAVRSAEAALAAVDKSEAALIAAWDTAGSSWPPPTPSPKLKQDRATAEDALAVARRTLSTVQRSMEAAKAPSQLAAIAASELANSDLPVVAVLVEEGQAALSRLTDALAKAAAAEGTVASLCAAILDRSWLREAGQINLALYEMPRPHPTVDPAPYADFIERLGSDADAPIGVS